VDDLEPIFYSWGDEWIRYSQCSWILWTDKELADLFERLRPYVDDHDQILIAPIDISQCVGSLSPWIWNWIQKHSDDHVYTGSSIDELMEHLLPPPEPIDTW